MATIGNNSTSEAAGITLGSVNVNATAPFNGAITAIHAHVAANNVFSITIALNGNNVTIPATAPPGYQTVSATGLNIPYTSGQNITLTANFVSAGGGGITSTIILGADLSTPDLWADYTGSGGGGGGTAPPNAPTVETWSPLSMSSWSVLYGELNQTAITQTLALQASFDGGSTWNTVDSHTNSGGVVPAAFTATVSGVPSGPLAFRAFASNAAGTTYSTVVTVTAPSTPAAPVLTAVTMTSWTVSGYGASFAYQYQVQRSTDGGSTWPSVGTVTTSSFTDTSVPAGSLAYRVQAQNSVGNTTGPSTTATVPNFGTTVPTLTEVLA